MHEILRNLPRGAFVLDLGCATGSFPSAATSAIAVRVDRDRPAKPAPLFVQADAALLPFRESTFAAVISNHSLEHFDHLSGALREIGRVTATGGALFIAVPDASTFTDRVYRWLGRGGGHVNAFTDAASLAVSIEQATGLKHVATRTLCSSLSFLNRNTAPRPVPRRLWLVGGGYPWTLCFYVWLSRRLDGWLGTRIGIYGWAFYFGGIVETVDTRTLVNVCVRCGAGHPSRNLEVQRRLGVKVWRCPACLTVNPFTHERCHNV